VPDILACIRGQFYAFEIKSEEGRLTDLQKLNIEQIKQAGGKAYVIRTYEEFKKIMSKLNGE
jgi:Holliday junction resolvase